MSLDGYIKRLETHENGRIEVVALTDEARVGSTESGREIYSVQVEGTFRSNYGVIRQINTTLYYIGEKGIKQGGRVEGYVKLVTLVSSNKVFLSALEDCYYIVVPREGGGVIIVPQPGEGLINETQQPQVSIGFG